MLQAFYDLTLTPELDRFVHATCDQIESEFLIGKKMNVVDSRTVLERMELLFRNRPDLARIVATATRNSIPVDTD